jgi:hypothetical protein
LRIFKVKVFSRFARREGVSDDSLIKAVDDAENGLIDADLGGGLIKQRVARPGEGKSGGYRTLLAFRSERMSVFLHGFAKSDLANIDDDELKTARAIAQSWLMANSDELDEAIARGKLQEVKRDERRKKK